MTVRRTLGEEGIMSWVTRWQGEFDRWWHRGERRGKREYKPTRDLTEVELAELSAELVRGAYTSYEQRQAAALARWLEVWRDLPVGDLTTTRDLRLARLEAAAAEVIAAVDRTADHTEWFAPISRLKTVLEEKVGRAWPTRPDNLGTNRWEPGGEDR